jgi:hypothetical protein
VRRHHNSCSIALLSIDGLFVANSRAGLMNELDLGASIPVTASTRKARDPCARTLNQTLDSLVGASGRP